MDLFEWITRPGKVTLKPYARDKPIILGDGMLVKTAGVWHQHIDLGTRIGDIEVKTECPTEVAGPYNSLNNEDATLIDQIVNSEDFDFKEVIVEREDANAIFGTVYVGDSEKDVGLIVRSVKSSDQHGNEFVGYGTPRVTTNNGMRKNLDLRTNTIKLRDLEEKRIFSTALGIWGVSNPEGYVRFSQGLEIATYWACQSQMEYGSILPIAAVGTAYLLINVAQSLKRVSYLIATDPDIDQQIEEIRNKIANSPPIEYLVSKRAIDRLRTTYSP